MVEIRGENFVAVVVETCRETTVPDATGTTDAMHVLINVVREIIIDDVHHVLDIETSRRDIRSNQNRCLPITERDHRVLPSTKSQIQIERQQQRGSDAGGVEMGRVLGMGDGGGTSRSR